MTDYGFGKTEGRLPPRPPGPPPPPPPPSGVKVQGTPIVLGSDFADVLFTAMVKVMREAMPSKEEIADAIRRGTKEAILEADD